tara:strand:+ start:937 stop:1455 length:519 start_codon:yes stop_codon:yes gene_type:complete
MKNRILSLFIISFLIFIFVVFYKSLNETNIYTPKLEINRIIPEFKTKTFFEKKNIKSTNIFNYQKFYLLNIWASWCLPCRDEHPILMSLSKNEKIEIIGLNYKDKYKNAEKFINQFGNPYSKILLDDDGTIAIEWGAFGVPESYLIQDNKIIIKFIGPLNLESLEEILGVIK